MPKDNVVNINRAWISIQEAVVAWPLKHFEETKRKSEGWMIKKILLLKNTKQYQKNTKKKTKITKEIRNSNQNWYSDKCVEIEKLQERENF